MKPGLSLRVSQHLALTPQLQQSIRLLQLSTLELAQEVEQMLDDNPFLELAADEAAPEPEAHEHQRQADKQPADRWRLGGAHALGNGSGLAHVRPHAGGAATPAGH